MRAVVCDRLGDPTVLKIEARPVPEVPRLRVPLGLVVLRLVPRCLVALRLLALRPETRVSEILIAGVVRWLEPWRAEPGLVLPLQDGVSGRGRGLGAGHGEPGSRLLDARRLWLEAA